MSTLDEAGAGLGGSVSDLNTWTRRFNYRVYLSTAPSLVVGLLTVIFAAQVPDWMRYPAQFCAGEIHSIAGIAGYSQHPSTVVLIMGWQWAFLPVYLIIWFATLPPWSRAVQVRITAKLRAIDRRTRRYMIFGFLFMAAYVLADVGLIPYFPTMLNARWAYPPSQASPLVLPIYNSNIVLMIYAWFSPIAEVSIWWTLIAYIPAFVPKLRAAGDPLRTPGAESGPVRMDRVQAINALRTIFHGYLATKRGFGAEMDRLALKGWPDRKPAVQALSQLSNAVMECEMLRFEYLLSHVSLDSPIWTSLQTILQRLLTDWLPSDESILGDANAAYRDAMRRWEAAERNRDPSALDEPMKDARRDPEFKLVCAAFAKRNNELDREFAGLRVKWPGHC
jgi:hypothetical protein